MAITALKKLSPFWYTPESEKDDDEPTKFKLKPLTSSQNMELASETKEGDNGQFTITGKGLYLALRMGLIGWSNFKDDHGKDVKFVPSNFDTLPPDLMVELATEIMSTGSMDDDEKKD